MAEKIKLKVNNDKFVDFINMLDKLSKIDDSIRLKIDKDYILLYSMIKSGQTALAFKSYSIETSEYLTCNEEFDYLIDLIIPNSKKFVKNLNFIKNSEKILFNITYKKSMDDDSIMTARSLQIHSTKLKINWVAGEPHEMKDMTKKSLEKNLNIKNRRWYFKVSEEDFDDIKKLSNINSSRMIYIKCEKNNVKILEDGSWEMEVDTIDEERNTELILNKLYLKFIDNDQYIEFSIFDNFLLIKKDESYLMLSYEKDFDDD
jgi:hypothetical protein